MLITIIVFIFLYSLNDPNPHNGNIHFLLKEIRIGNFNALTFEF